eukprot:TRINITY_DN19842_c0_g1_i1.p1 TRINITY_DN19842_c0_g1~~TRINITY_DN19842_c0_g1_i1.p1  ORF type:complete len:191 (-),score=60.22 TRINITY_DN19842_c0_g1_i1:282-854(-)
MRRRPPRSTLSSSSAASDVYKRQTEASAMDDDLFGDDLFGEIADEAPFGGDPEAVQPKKKKKKSLKFDDIKKHGYEPPPPIEESETYKRIQTDRIIAEQEEVQHKIDAEEEKIAQAESARLANIAKHKAQAEEQQAQVAQAATAEKIQKRSTVKDKTKNKRALGQTGISGTANGHWKSDQEFHMTRDGFD